jgi:hypothetical protein
MINHATFGLIALAIGTSTLGAQARSQPPRPTPIPTLTPTVADTTKGTMAGCPGGNGIHISTSSGNGADSSAGVNQVIGIGQSVDTTLVFDISRKTWTRTNLAAAISVGLADESRGRYAVCAGVSALLPSVNLTVQGARGRVHFVASLKDFNDALRLGPGR